MEPKTFTVNLSVLLLKAENGGWVAQCLEYDLAAQGSTLAIVKDAFARTVVGQMLVDIEHNIEPLSSFAPAPSNYWETFRKAERLADRQPLLVPAGSLPPACMIRAMANDLRVSA